MLDADCIAAVLATIDSYNIAAHEAKLRENNNIEKILKMPVAYYSGCLSGERAAQLNLLGKGA